MKKIIAFLLLGLFCIGAYAQEAKDDVKKADDFVWTKEKAEKHLRDQSDSTKWDMRLFRVDLKNVDKESANPITFGVFPVPKYDSLGEKSFGGLGVSDGRIRKVQDKLILNHNYISFESPVNSEYLEGKESEVFFNIIVLSDFVDTDKYTHISSHVISRNHPHYIGQGFFKTKNNKIDYTAFITADRNSYAIVNMRLFDLNLGRTVLIAPQKDKSLRSLQINSPNLSHKEIEAYTDELLKKKEIVEFFTKEGSI